MPSGRQQAAQQVLDVRVACDGQISALSELYGVSCGDDGRALVLYGKGVI